MEFKPKKEISTKGIALVVGILTVLIIAFIITAMLSGKAPVTLGNYIVVSVLTVFGICVLSLLFKS